MLQALERVSKTVVFRLSFPIRSFPYLILLNWREEKPFCSALGKNPFGVEDGSFTLSSQKNKSKGTNCSSSAGCCCDASVAKRKEAVTLQRLAKHRNQYSLRSLTVSFRTGLWLVAMMLPSRNVEAGRSPQFFSYKKGIVQLRYIEDSGPAWPPRSGRFGPTSLVQRNRTWRRILLECGLQ